MTSTFNQEILQLLEDAQNQEILKLLEDAQNGKGTQFANIKFVHTKELDKLSVVNTEYHCIYILSSSLSDVELERKILVVSSAIRLHIYEFHSCGSAHEIVHDVTCGSLLRLIAGVRGVQVIQEKSNIFCIYVVL